MTNEVCSTTVVCELVVLATYDRNHTSAALLEQWQSAGPRSQYQRIEAVNDCLAVMYRVPLTISDSSPDVPAAREVIDAAGGLPDDQQLGLTRLLLFRGENHTDSLEAIHRLLGLDTDELDGGDWPGEGQLLAGPDPERLICICPADHDFDRLLAGPLGSAIRLQETLRHKMRGQFAEYAGHFRNRLLEAESQLSERLARLGSLACGDGPGCGPATERILAASREVTSAYCQAALVHGPVRKVEAMLSANLANLREAAERLPPAGDHDYPAAGLLRQRAARYEMLVAQVRADLGLVEPVFDAARCVGQFHHGQLLAQLATTEASENRQRDRQSRDRERHNLRLMGLGLWLGLSQLWFAWIAMWPVATRPDGVQLLGWCLVPTAVGIIGWVAVCLVKRLVTMGEDR